MRFFFEINFSFTCTHAIFYVILQAENKSCYEILKLFNQNRSLDLSLTAAMRHITYEKTPFTSSYCSPNFNPK